MGKATICKQASASGLAHSVIQTLNASHGIVHALYEQWHSDGMQMSIWGFMHSADVFVVQSLALAHTEVKDDIVFFSPWKEQDFRTGKDPW